YWVNFAVNGDPNGKGLPQWPRFTSKQQNVLTVNNDGPQVVENPEGKRMDVLEPLSLGLMRAAP
ncbi:MAG: carboxylesterase family protein, partial [Steroidobacteraceae bacterium]